MRILTAQLTSCGDSAEVEQVSICLKLTCHPEARRRNDLDDSTTRFFLCGRVNVFPHL